MKRAKTILPAEITMTAQQYATKRGISKAAVCESLRNYTPPSNALPGVISVTQLGIAYNLTVDPSKITKGRLKKYSKKVQDEFTL